MSRHRSGFRQVALLVAGSAALLFSCEGKQAADASAQDEAMMTMYSEDLSVVESKNGRKSYHFVTPMMEEYGLAREPYREFRKGVKIVTFNDDSVSSVDATLTANYAIYYTNRELWEARGNVVAETAGDRTLYTEQLFWNAKTKRIYSNVDSKIVQSDGVFYGEGLESDDALRDWRFRRMTGRMEVEVKPTADTTAAGSTRTGSTRTGSDAPSGDRASVPVAAGGAGTAAPRAVAGPAEARALSDAGGLHGRDASGASGAKASPETAASVAVPTRAEAAAGAPAPNAASDGPEESSRSADGPSRGGAGSTPAAPERTADESPDSVRNDTFRR